MQPDPTAENRRRLAAICRRLAEGVEQHGMSGRQFFQSILDAFGKGGIEPPGELWAAAAKYRDENLSSDEVVMRFREMAERFEAGIGGQEPPGS